MQATAAGPLGDVRSPSWQRSAQSVLTLPSQVLVQPAGSTADPVSGVATTTMPVATRAVSAALTIDRCPLRISAPQRPA